MKTKLAILLIFVAANGCVPQLEGAPFNIHVGSEASEYMEIIQNGVAYVEEQAGCHLFFFDESAPPDIKIISREPREEGWAASARPGNPATIELYQPPIAGIIPHEILHLLGFEHVDDVNNIMYPTIHFGPQGLDEDQLDALRGWCPTEAQ